MVINCIFSKSEIYITSLDNRMEYLVDNCNSLLHITIANMIALVKYHKSPDPFYKLFVLNIIGKTP